MSKYLRLSEKWFRRGLWLVSLVFASFLIGLGGAVVNDLPRVTQTLTWEAFLDQEQAQPLRQGLKGQAEAQEAALKKQASLAVAVEDAQRTNRNAQASFDNWVRTRTATQQPGYDGELVQRTQALDGLKARVDEAEEAYAAQEAYIWRLNEEESQLQQKLRPLTEAAEAQWRVAQRHLELKVFLYRLAVTLPLLAVAGWLFVKQRHGQYWPFVWGFIFFAGFAFFVELVPYLPSYGGYVRYAVGIVLTGVIGHYAIKALNRYLAQQKLEETQPEAQRRQALSYDVAMARFSKSVCPGCERAVALSSNDVTFCPHCGISLFDECDHCHSRKNAFSPYCHHCGAKETKVKIN